MQVKFAGEMVEVKDLIAQCLASNYLQFGFADDGEADRVAGRLLKVLDDLGCEIVSKPRPLDYGPQYLEGPGVDARRNRKDQS